MNHKPRSGSIFGVSGIPLFLPEGRLKYCRLGKLKMGSWKLPRPLMM
jgi:hypothetical protein